MKYVYKNLLCFIRYDTGIWMLTILTVIVSALFTCFSYGIYQNYHVLIKEKKAETDAVLIHFDDTEDSFVTKEMLDPCLEELAGKIPEMHNTQEICSVEMEIDGQRMESRFLLQGNSTAYSNELAKNLKTYGHLTRGDYWSELEEINGEPVAICFDYECVQTGTMADYIKEHMIGEDRISIGGQEYRITGFGTLWYVAEIPYSSLDPEQHLKEFCISFHEGVTLQTFEIIRNVFMNHLGGKISIPEIRGMSSNLYYLYQTISLIVMGMMMICALNSVFLYLYVLSKRKKQAAIMRICGLPEWKEYLMNIGECLLTSVPVYIITVLIYAARIMEPVSSHFPYMQSSYSKKLYAWIIAGYILIAILTSSVMIIQKNRSIREQIR